MSKKLNIPWYVSGGGPQCLSVDPDEFVDCETAEQVTEVINELLDQAFEMRVTWYADRLPEHAAEIWKLVQELRSQDED